MTKILGSIYTPRNSIASSSITNHDPGDENTDQIGEKWQDKENIKNLDNLQLKMQHNYKYSEVSLNLENNNDCPMKKVENFEDVLEASGGFGLFQLVILVLLLILEVPTAFVTFIPIFVGKVPKTWICNSDPDKFFSAKDICSLSCNGTIAPYPSDVLDDSIVAQWGLICDKEWVFDFITSIQMLGMFFGSVFGSQFADWYGRKYGFLGATFLLIFGSILSAVSPNPYVYAVARFWCGVGVTSFMNVTLVGVVEVMPTKWRSLSNCVGPTGEGIMILSGLAYFIRAWRTLYWITIAPFSLILVIFPFVPESPRWLMKQNRVEDAHKVLKYMAKMNRKHAVDFETLKKIVEEEKTQENAQASRKRGSYLDFVRDKSLRVTSIYNMAIWFAWALTYYGISFNIKNVEGSIYLNVLFMGLANSLGQRSALFINNSLGRRKALFASMTFCAFFSTSLAVYLLVFETSSVVIISLCLLGQFGMASARSAARLLSGESFPTAVRTMGMGIGGITANIAGILTPQVAFLGTRYPSLPFFIFAGVSMLGSLISFLMGETMGQPLDAGGQTTPTNEEKGKSTPTSLNSVCTNLEKNSKATNLRSNVVLMSIYKLADDKF